jgi:hypothetical protein
MVIDPGSRTATRPARYDRRTPRTSETPVVWFMRRIGIALLAGSLAAGASAGAGEKAQSAANKASGVATKTENAVKRGLGTAASGVERGAKAAGSAVTGVAKKVGIPGAGASSPARPQTKP